MRRTTTAGIVLALAFGVLAGLGAYTFQLRRGAFLLQQRPAACANCHVMRDAVRLLAEVAATTRAPPATTATCRTTCARASTWRRRATAGTTREASRCRTSPSRSGSRRRTWPTCSKLHRSCHADMVSDIAGARPGGPTRSARCTHCHPRAVTGRGASGRAEERNADMKNMLGLHGPHGRRDRRGDVVRAALLRTSRSARSRRGALRPARGAQRGHRRPRAVGQELPAPVRRLQAHRGHPSAPATAAARRSRSSTTTRAGKRIFAGYAFGVDYREERGHAYMLQRPGATPSASSSKQPGACLHCHASITAPTEGRRRRPAAADGGTDEGLRDGLRDAADRRRRKLVEHPVACIDCHDPRPWSCASRGPASSTASGLAASKRRCRTCRVERGARTGARTTTRTRWPRARRCARSSAASATSSTTSRATASCVTYPWHKGLKVEQIESLLRRGRLEGLDPRRDRRAGAQGAAPRVRDVEPGHPRAQRRGLRRLPHALHARGRASRSPTTTCAARC